MRDECQAGRRNEECQGVLRGAKCCYIHTRPPLHHPDFRLLLCHLRHTHSYLSLFFITLCALHTYFLFRHLSQSSFNVVIEVLSVREEM